MKSASEETVRLLYKLDSDTRRLLRQRDPSGRAPADLARRSKGSGSSGTSLAAHTPTLYEAVRAGHVDATSRLLRIAQSVVTPMPWLPVTLNEPSFQNG
jgi:hypothetical protein